MRKSINGVFRTWLHRRYARIARIKEAPEKMQHILLQRFVTTAKFTEYGRRYNFQKNKNCRRLSPTIAHS